MTGYCFRSELWEGQNKRTGEVGEFPEIVFSIQPLRGTSDNTSHTRDTANANNTSDLPLIDLGDPTGVGKKTTDVEASGKQPPFPNWTTFESTTDLLVATETNPFLAADVSASAKDAADVSEVDGNIRSCSESSSKEAGNIAKCGSENVSDRRHATIDCGRNADLYYDVEVDVPDSVLLLPSVSHTSVSEPCSPAHLAGVDNPELLANGEDGSQIDKAHGLCHSLPAHNMSERLSWMTSASCENLNSGAGPALHNNGLCGHAQFAEHLSKASSDSPMYVGNAPPVPPRDYPSCRPPPSDAHHRTPSLPKSHARPQHTEIHPIMQDGQRRSSTHYWLLPEKQRFDALPAPCDDSNPISYVNVPDGRSDQEKSARKVTKSKPVAPTTATAAETSHTAMDDMMRRLDISMADRSLESMAEIRDKVDLVRMDVGFDAVTFEESLSALSVNHWSVEEAVRYIKVEHLFRLGIATRDICREALVAYQWDLQNAASCLVDRQSGPDDQ